MSPKAVFRWSAFLCAEQRFAARHHDPGHRRRPRGFNARFAAVRKTYRYNIYHARRPSPFWHRYAWHVADQLDLAAMQKGAGLLSGTLDFRSFCASGSAVKHFVRTIEKNERVQGLGFVFQLVILMAAYLRYRVKKSLEQEGTPLVTPQKQKLDHPTVRVILDMLAELMVIRSGH